MSKVYTVQVNSYGDVGLIVEKKDGKLFITAPVHEGVSAIDTRNTFLVQPGVYVKVEYGDLYSESDKPGIFRISEKIFPKLIVKDTGFMDSSLRTAITLLYDNQHYRAIEATPARYRDFTRVLPKYTGEKTQAAIDLFVDIQEIEQSILLDVTRKSKSQLKSLQPMRSSYTLHVIRCDKDNNVGLSAVSHQLHTSKNVFTAPWEHVKGDISNEGNVFRVSDGSYFKIEFHEIYSGLRGRGVYKVPPSAFAAMLLKENSDVMCEQTRKQFMELFKYERYWAMPRQLPELEGADIEESLSLARHCVHITRNIRCSMKAPITGEIHFDLDIEPAIQYFMYTYQCDKNNNVGLIVRSDGDKRWFAAPMRKCAQDEQFDIRNTFQMDRSGANHGWKTRSCIKLKFGDIFSEPDKDPVFIVPQRAFAAMLHENNYDIMEPGEYGMLWSLCNHPSYWTASRRLPELEGADLEEGLSLARHCLFATSLPGCSIRAPVKRQDH